MPGVLFVVCIPTAEYERCLLYGTSPVVPPSADMFPSHGFQKGPGGEILMKIDTSDPKEGLQRHGLRKLSPLLHSKQQSDVEKHETLAPRILQSAQQQGTVIKSTNEIVPMEQILEEILKKLKVEHIVWCNDKNGYYYQVFFPVVSGDPCENCLHCLTEMGIGIKSNSVISVVPCTVYYEGIHEGDEDDQESPEKKAWINFVQSIRAKLTVKSVVDGVRGGAECSFDYLMLVLTADTIAALGLVENNALNIVAAMLVSPLMNPVMAATFGTAIADKKLQKIGLRSEIIGLSMSLIFGFIFGLLVGTTDNPWGSGDWPTEEMTSRGMVRSLWIGVLWAVPSGTGVALALLQGSAGPLIGVAISASLLPPAVNCGMLWGLACIALIYDDVKIPYVKGENYTGSTSATLTYTTVDRYPSELAIMGIISFCVTLVNIMCIFTAAIIVLKIKEVAAPYTSGPELRRFWEHDIRIARNTNRATMSHGHEKGGTTDVEQAINELSSVPTDELEYTLEAAVREAVDDSTFQNVNRCSYSASTKLINHVLGLGNGNSNRASGMNHDTSPLQDREMLDHVIRSLMDFQSQQTQDTQQTTVNRFHQLSQSLHRSSRKSSIRRQSTRTSLLRDPHSVHSQHDHQGGMTSDNTGLPTIMENNTGEQTNSGNISLQSLAQRALKAPVVRNIVRTLSSSQSRFGLPPGSPSVRQSEDKFEKITLTVDPE